MASVLQQYSQLADFTATQITGSYQSWTDFLTTAARLYKYPYHEQLMIYAQRPDATACADYELWNKRMGRYVRRGAKGIALIDHSGDAPKLKYVFDVADTRTTERSRSPYLWEYRPEHEQAVSAALEEQFAVPNDGSITEQLEQISSVKVTEYFLAHQQDILGIVDGSYLEEYHDYDKGVAFINAATVSTTYALLSRCSLAADAHFDPEEFTPVFDFNTPQTVFALGSAVSEISEKVLRSIEVTIKKYEREKLSERSQENERTDLHTQRGLLDSQSEPVPAGEQAPGQVREDAESIPSGVSPGAVEQPDPVGAAVPPSAGDRRDGEQAVGADDAHTDAVGGGDGSSESQRPHEMAGADEQPESPGRGSDSDGADLRLTDEPPIQGEQFSFSDDSSYFLLCALEVMDDDGNFQRKADMFTKRTIQPHRVVNSVDTASEALTLSIAEKAEVNMEYMSNLTGKTAEELASELRGVIFHDPTLGAIEDNEGWVTADEYLSGNVRQKLRQAEAAAAENPSYQINVEALRAAQPKDLDASEIEVRLGATWIDRSYIKQFMFETFDTPRYLRYSMDVQYSPYTAAWSISSKTRISYNDVAAWNTYGTDCVSAYEILEDSLNLRDVQVFDTIEDADGKKKRVLNAKETTLAAQKQQLIRDAFKDWIWADPQRRQALVRQYNEEMNSTRPREYDGRHIVFAGMNPEITLREHQRNAIAHVLYGGNTLLAHEVGAGKTFEMVAAAMESKRLGLCQKSIFVVPNHLTEQWASEFLRLYPSANILVTKQRDFETKNRKKFCARIATGDYDAVIIGHSQFEKIPISKQRQERLLQDQIAEITMGISELRESGGEKFTVKELERTKRGLESRLEKLRADDKKDDVVTFEELGVDRMFVDEAHNYKNLFLYTKMRNVAGLSTTDAQKSSDMFGKCRYMDELTGNRGVVFATGTPVSNSMTELYTMQRYLQYARLEEMHMTHFDCWASRFGETVTALELAPEGKGYRPRTRFSRFFNLPELMNLFKEVADIKTADQLHLPVPQVEYHNVVAKPTEVQQGLVQELSERAAAIHSGSVDPSIDNMLKVTSDGRKLGLDQRIINPDFLDEAGSKVNLCVDNILQVWQNGEADKLTQLVFCDISTPQAAPKAKQAVIAGNPLEAAALPAEENAPFTVYDDIRSKLIAGGVPAEQIAFIHDANTEVKKKELFGKVRSGQVRVLLGSTSKMGAGTNVQDRLVAIHDLDCPWRPGDLQQRKGRIERQGNQNEKVHVFRYVTEGTFDAFLWQTVENKQKFISQIMTSKSPVRSCNDVDEVALSFAEIKALCAGDPRIKERMDLDVEVSRLKIMKADHKSKQYRLEDSLLRHFPEQVEKLKGCIQAIQEDMNTLEAHPHPTDGFAGMTVLADELTDKDNAGAALIEAAKKATGLDPVEVGTYRGFQMSVTLEDFGKKYVLTMQGRLKHQAILGSDPRGNLIRLDNALAQMPQRLKAFQTQLDETCHQQEAAKAELGKPFPFEEELRDKTARLIFLDSELNLDANKGGQTEQVIAKSARPSVLDKLRSQPAPIRNNQKQKRHEEVR